VQRLGGSHPAWCGGSEAGRRRDPQRSCSQKATREGAPLVIEQWRAAPPRSMQGAICGGGDAGSQKASECAGLCGVGWGKKRLGSGD
jgi:hypothetical protein